MAMNKKLIWLVVVLTWISESFSRSLSTIQVSESHNSTRNSTVPTVPTSRPFEGLTPVVITCAVLLQLLLPFVYCFCCRGFKACFMDKLQQAEKRQRKKWGESLIKRHEWGDSCCRLVSLHFYFSFFLWFVYLICYNVLNWSKYGVVFKNLHIMAIVVIVFSALFVLIESFFSNEYEHLDHPMQKEEIIRYIKRLRNKAPEITMSVECSHLEDRPRGNGKGTKLTKIVTYSGTREFRYGSFEDVSSPEMPWISHSVLTRLKIDAFIDFGDAETEEEFERQRSEYYNAFYHFDKDFSFRVSYDIPGLDHRILAYIDPSQTDGWISGRYFWYATCCCLTWPYRWLFRAKTAQCRYDFKKKMYMSVKPLPSDFQDPDDNPPLTESKENPSFSMTGELPNDASRTCSNGYPSHQDTNLLTNQEEPYTSANQEGSYCPTNEVTTHAQINQDPDSPAANQRVLYVPLLLQEEPDIPPPSYDMATDSAN